MFDMSAMPLRERTSHLTIHKPIIERWNATVSDNHEHTLQSQIPSIVSHSMAISETIVPYLSSTLTSHLIASSFLSCSLWAVTMLDHHSIILNRKNNASQPQSLRPKALGRWQALSPQKKLLCWKKRTLHVLEGLANRRWVSSTEESETRWRLSGSQEVFRHIGSKSKSIFPCQNPPNGKKLARTSVSGSVPRNDLHRIRVEHFGSQQNAVSHRPRQYFSEYLHHNAVILILLRKLAIF